MLAALAIVYAMVTFYPDVCHNGSDDEEIKENSRGKEERTSGGGCVAIFERYMCTVQQRAWSPIRVPQPLRNLEFAHNVLRQSCRVCKWKRSCNAS